MAVAGNADPMLGYLTTSFREYPANRRALGKIATRSMQQRLTALGALADPAELQPRADTVTRLYAHFVKRGGDHRTADALEAEGRQRLQDLQARGFDLALDSEASHARVEAIYQHARHALYATLDDGVLGDATSDAVRVRSAASHRDEYLARPPAGEALQPDDARYQVAQVCAVPPPQIQFVISDGLNALAVNELLRDVLPRARRGLIDAGCRVADA